MRTAWSAGAKLQVWACLSWNARSRAPPEGPASGPGGASSRAPWSPPQSFPFRPQFAGPDPRTAEPRQRVLPEPSGQEREQPPTLLLQIATHAPGLPQTELLVQRITRRPTRATPIIPALLPPDSAD